MALCTAGCLKVSSRPFRISSRHCDILRSTANRVQPGIIAMH